jgi:hypothetical protein
MNPKITVPMSLLARGFNSFLITRISNPLEQKTITIFVLSLYHATNAATNVSIQGYLQKLYPKDIRGCL